MGNRHQHRRPVLPLLHSPHQKHLLVDEVLEEVLEVDEVGVVADVKVGAEAHTDAAWDMGTRGPTVHRH